MSPSPELAPDPSRIGVIAEAPFAILPDPVALFSRRATRFAFLAGSSRLAPYLSFLAELSRIQSEIAAGLPAPEPIPSDVAERARTGAMPPIAGAELARSAGFHATLEAVTEAARGLAQPEAARAALEHVRAGGPADWERMALNLIAATVPAEEAAPHLYVAAGLQLHAARRAAMLDAARLVPVGTGACPCCGGRPAVSLVTDLPRLAASPRYAACATCQTLWNEVRVKCLACGSTKGISYRSLDAEGSVIKAEVCDPCRSWVKVLYQDKDPALEPIADDVGSLGLDALMRETDWRRAGFDPFLIGY